MNSPKVVLQLQGSSFAARYQLASQAITAAVAGGGVLVVLWFDALQRWVEGGFDEPLSGEDAEVARRHLELGLPSPERMLAEARQLGVVIAACETGVRLAGLDPDSLQTKIDRLPGLQEIQAAAREAELALFL